MGDSVLREIASVMLRYTNRNFQIFRYGGDEFLAWDTSGSEEKAIANLETMMQEITKIHIYGCDFPIHMSYGACFGLAKREEDLRNLRYQADERLYEVKRARPKA